MSYDAMVIFLESALCGFAVVWIKRARTGKHVHVPSLLRLDGVTDGIFLGIGCFEFFPHALEDGHALGIGPLSVLMMLVLGFAAFAYVQSFLGVTEQRACCPSDFRKMMVSRSALLLLSVHAVLEGIALGVVHDQLIERILLYSIVLHKGLESMAFAAAAVAAFSSYFAFVSVIVFALMTPLGMFFGHALSLWVFGFSGFMMNLLAALSFIYMGVQCILNRPDERAKHLPSLIFGWLMVLTVMWACGHVHIA